MEQVKHWIGVWAITAKSFFRHPILTTKQFFKDFMEADVTGKIKKIILVVLFLFICYQVFVAVCCLLCVLALLGGALSQEDIYQEKKEHWDQYYDPSSPNYHKRHQWDKQ